MFKDDGGSKPIERPLFEVFLESAHMQFDNIRNSLDVTERKAELLSGSEMNPDVKSKEPVNETKDSAGNALMKITDALERVNSHIIDLNRRFSEFI